MVAELGDFVGGFDGGVGVLSVDDDVVGVVGDAGGVAGDFAFEVAVVVAAMEVGKAGVGVIGGGDVGVCWDLGEDFFELFGSLAGDVEGVVVPVGIGVPEDHRQGGDAEGEGAAPGGEGGEGGEEGGEALGVRR